MRTKMKKLVMILASACPDSTVGEGLAISGKDTQNDPDSVQDKVNEWLSGLGY